MSKTHATPIPAIPPGASFHNGVFELGDVTEQEQPDAQALMRVEIVNYIKSRLGPQLCGAPINGGITYADAVASSTDTGCYDHSWMTGDYTRIEQYIANLKQTWLRSQGDVSSLVAKILHLRAFGTQEQKKLLEQLELQ